MKGPSRPPRRQLAIRRYAGEHSNGFDRRSLPHHWLQPVAAAREHGDDAANAAGAVDDGSLRPRGDRPADKPNRVRGPATWARRAGDRLIPLFGAVSTLLDKPPASCSPLFVSLFILLAHKGEKYRRKKEREGGREPREKVGRKKGRKEGRRDSLVGAPAF